MRLRLDLWLGERFQQRIATLAAGRVWMMRIGVTHSWSARKGDVVMALGGWVRHARMVDQELCTLIETAPVATQEAGIDVVTALVGLAVKGVVGRIRAIIYFVYGSGRAPPFSFLFFFFGDGKENATHCA